MSIQLALPRNVQIIEADAHGSDDDVDAALESPRARFEPPIVCAAPAASDLVGWARLHMLALRRTGT